MSANEIKLRDYQEVGITRLRNALTNHKHVIFSACVSYGKTVIMSFMAKGAVEKGNKVLIVSHRSELMTQTGGTLERVGIQAEYISPKHRNIPTGLVVSAMAQTLRRRLEKPEWVEWIKSVKLVQIDECFRGDVEILTDKGYVRFDSLQGNERVAQYIDNGNIEFVKPLRFIKRYHEGEMCKLTLYRGKYVYMTPNHNQIYKIKGKEGVYSDCVKNIKFNILKYIPINGKGSGRNDLLTDLERLFIAIQADGTFQHECLEYDSYSIKLTRPKKINHFLDISKNIECREIKCNRKNTRRWMCKIPKGNAKLLSTHFSIEMGYDRAVDFINEVVKWDGSVISDNLFYYSSVVKENADFVSSVAVQAGYRAYIIVEKDNRKSHYKDVYRVFMHKTGYINGQNIKKEYVEYNGYVYCVEVPSHNIVVRANESFTFISGNCHTSDADFLFESGLLDDKYVVGLTGTPMRSGNQRQLGMNYEDIVETAQIQDMMDRGNITKLRTFTVDAPDLSKVNTDYRTGDFDSRQMGAVFNKSVQYKGVIENYMHICPMKKAICFDATQANAIRMCAEFNEAGIPAKFLISGIDKNKPDELELYEKYKHFTGNREQLIKDFHDGKFTVICNSGILSTGYDETSIEVCILNRATQSVQFYIQATGRAIRLHPGKTEAFLLDFGGNISRLGKFEKERKWALWHNKGKCEGIQGVKECKQCGKYIAITASECPFCGYVYPTEKEIRMAELQELVGDLKFEQMTPTQFFQYAELKGYNTYWAIRQLYIRNTETDFRKAMKECGYSSKFIWGYIQRNKK